MCKAIVLYIGMPGSGKTYVANEECDIVIDDITDLSQLPEREKLVGKILGISDVNFCDPNILIAAIDKLKNMYMMVPIRSYYFENDSSKCRSNVIYRNDGRNVEGTIKRFEKIYNPPMNAHKIWSP